MPDWPPALAIASLVLGCTVYYVATAWFSHRERMAKIQQGIDPDQPKRPEMDKPS